jgi:hypothetical protein
MQSTGGIVTRPDDIVIMYMEDENGLPWTGEGKPDFVLTWRYKPIKRWTFDQYVGVERAQELGIWKSNDDPDRKWDIRDSITLYQDNDASFGDCMLVVKVDDKEMIISTYVDQWGTYYTFKGHEDLVIACEEGRMGFWKGYIEALEELRKRTEFKMADPIVEDFEN